jgi:hypothetical protein
VKLNEKIIALFSNGICPYPGVAFAEEAAARQRRRWKKRLAKKAARKEGARKKQRPRRLRSGSGTGDQIVSILAILLFRAERRNREWRHRHHSRRQPRLLLFLRNEPSRRIIPGTSIHQRNSLFVRLIS